MASTHWRHIPLEGIQNYSKSQTLLLKQSIQPEYSYLRREMRQHLYAF